MDDPSNLGKSVRCPVCKEKHRFVEFRIVKKEIPGVSKDNDKTDLGFLPSSSDKTELPEISNPYSFKGYLLDTTRGKEYPLNMGINLIGRKTFKTPSFADIAIETSDMGFSRKHLYIDVSRDSEGKYRFVAYNAENKNPTFINGILIEKEDKVILHADNMIKSSDTVLVLKLH